MSWERSLPRAVTRPVSEPSDSTEPGNGGAGVAELVGGRVLAVEAHVEGGGAVAAGSAEADGEAGGQVEEGGGARGGKGAGFGVGSEGGVDAAEHQVADLEAAFLHAGLQAGDPGGWAAAQRAGRRGPRQAEVGTLEGEFAGVDAPGDQRAEGDAEADGIDLHDDAVAGIVDLEVGGGEKGLWKEVESDVAVDLDGAADPGGDNGGDAGAVAVPVEHAGQDPDDRDENGEKRGHAGQDEAAGAQAVLLSWGLDRGPDRGGRCRQAREGLRFVRSSGGQSGLTCPL